MSKNHILVILIVILLGTSKVYCIFTELRTMSKNGWWEDKQGKNGMRDSPPKSFYLIANCIKEATTGMCRR